jgi:hypothetical protein
MMRMTCRPCCDTRAPPRDGETKVIESETRIKGRSDATNAMVTLAVVIACSEPVFRHCVRDRSSRRRRHSAGAARAIMNKPKTTADQVGSRVGRGHRTTPPNSKRGLSEDPGDQTVSRSTTHRRRERR